MPAEKDKLTTDQEFQKNLIKENVKEFRAVYFGHDIKFSILPRILRAMQSTMQKAIKGHLREGLATNPTAMPIFVNNFIKANWSWAIASYPFSGKSEALNYLTDLESMILQDMASRNAKASLVYLEDLIVDVKNKLAYKKWSPSGSIEYGLVCPTENNRSRSRLSNRKPFEPAAAYQKASIFFAPRIADFAL